MFKPLAYRYQLNWPPSDLALCMLVEMKVLYDSGIMDVQALECFPRNGEPTFSLIGYQPGKNFQNELI